MHTCGSAASSSARATATSSASPGWRDAVDQADALGLDAVDAPSGEDQVDGPAVPDEPGQAHRAEVDERHAEAPAVDAERGVGGGDAQVAPHGQLEPAGDGGTLDGGDDRLAEAQPCRPHRARPVIADRAPVTVGERLEVGAGAEVPAGAGEHGHGQGVVGVERLERLEQQRRRGRVDGVAPLRTVDRDDADRTAIGDPDRSGVRRSWPPL